MEQRIDTIEEELKVLKSQIKAVLLDIKESLATGIGYAYAPPQEGGGTVVAGPVSSGIASVPDIPSQEPQAGPQGTDSGDRTVEQAQPNIVPKRDQPQEIDSIALRNGSKSRAVDLLTVSVLAQWITRAAAAVGRDQIGKLVEIYDVTGNLEPRLKDTMLLLADLGGDGGQTEDATVTDYVPTAVSLQLLVELDGLLRCRNDALESAVLSQLMDNGLGFRKAGSGHG
jgi:hypothetical protein